MNKRELRELCVKKDFSTPRNPQRIPVICGLIRELWERYRLYDSSVGFLKIIDIIQNFPSPDNEEDKFYWEDDRWYDRIQYIIDDSKMLIQNNRYIENVMDMTEIVKCFQDYWLTYPDYRLQQILNVFGELLQLDVRRFDTMDSKVWKKFFLGKRIKQLKSSISVAIKRKKEMEKDKIDAQFKEFIQGLIDAFDVIITKQQLTLNQLEKEYKDDFGL